MLNKLVRIGKNAELRYTAAGKAVIGLSCVYDIGWGDKKKAQWIDVSIWGKQAEALAPYLLKGNQIVIYAEDVEIEEYPKNDGTQGVKLKCRAVNIDLTDSKSNDSQSPQTAPPQQPQPGQMAQGYQQPTNNNQAPPQQPQPAQQMQQAPQGRQVGGGAYAPAPPVPQPMNNDFDSEINF